MDKAVFAFRFTIFQYAIHIKLDYQPRWSIIFYWWYRGRWMGQDQVHRSIHRLARY